MVDRTILISGAGIAGPTLAYWLLEYGFRPVVVEPAPRLRTGGYIIDFWGVGYDVAERMGILPAIEAAGYQIESLRLVDRNGRRIGGFSADVFREVAGGRYASIARGALAETLAKTVLDRCEFIFGDSITSIEQDEDGVNVAFEHATERRVDLVVGADGLHSNVRSLVFGDQARFEKHLGYTVAAFEAKGYPRRDEGVYLGCTLPGRQVARFSMRDERTLFLFVFGSEWIKSAHPADPAERKTVIRKVYHDAGWECPAILDAMDRCADLYFDRVSQIHMPAWSNGRVVLVGDAACCASLLAGQGSALAMTGAFVLAGELAQADGHHTEGCRAYERTLRPFIEGKQRTAARFGSAFAPRTQLGLFLRNRLSRLCDIRPLGRLMMGRSLRDRFELPEYGGTADPTRRCG